MEKSNRKTIRKIVKRFLITLAVLIGLLISTLLVIGIFFDKEVKEFLVKQLNKQLNSKISVQKIELTLFEKFPMASLKFTGVVAKDATNSEQKDTLLIAQKVYLQFNIWDIFEKKYQIKNIDIENADLKLKVYNDESDNYHFWKPTVDSSATSPFSINLKSVKFNNVTISYTNNPAEQKYKFKIETLKAKGDLSDKINDFSLSGNVDVQYFISDGINYMPRKFVTLDAIIKVNNDKENWTFSDCKFSFGKLKFLFNGAYNFGEFSKSVNINIQSNEADLSSFIEELPENIKPSFSNYSAKGMLNVNLSIKGPLSSKKRPLVFCSYMLSNGSLHEPKSDITLENINFSGSYSNYSTNLPEKYKVSFENLSAKLKNGQIRGSLNISNFLHPEVSFTGKLQNFELAEVLKFIGNTDIESAKGVLNTDINMWINPSDFSHLKMSDFLNSKTSGTLALENIGFTLKNNPVQFYGINGNFTYNNNDIIINSFTGNINKSDFKLSGYFKNVLPFVFLENQSVEINAHMASNNFNLEDLLTSDKSTSSAKPFRISFPSTLSASIDAEIGNLKFKKFSSTQVKSRLVLRNKQMIINSLQLNTMGGKIYAKGLLDATPKEKVLISFEASVNNVNVSQMFYQMGNFGQENGIMDENIKGNLNTDIQYAAVYKDDLTVEKTSIFAHADVTIENGELNNYAPLLKLSKFVRLDDLKNVRFSTLENKIDIKNETITIPKMDIKSNALNLQMKGTHKFNNEINYQLQILLSELLSDKTRKANKQNEEFGLIEDDGLGKTTLFINISGTIDKPKFKYDKLGVKEKLKIAIKSEKQNLINVLNKEFGWFKKQSTTDTSSVKNNNNKQNDTKFSIEWNDDNDKKPQE